jgi:hypothetical protein
MASEVFNPMYNNDSESRSLSDSDSNSGSDDSSSDSDSDEDESVDSPAEEAVPPPKEKKPNRAGGDHRSAGGGITGSAEYKVRDPLRQQSQQPGSAPISSREDRQSCVAIGADIIDGAIGA